MSAPNDVALAGPDGRRAAELLSAAEKTGRDLLGDLVGRAAARLLRETGGDPARVAQAQVLFDDAELEELAQNLSSTIATADLLGRVRVRERARLAREAAVETFAEAPDPFALFADPVRVQPPALAVESFRRLVPSLDRSAVRYGPLLDRHAFTLAVATDQVLLEKVKAAILAQLEGTSGDATPDVQAILDAAGVSPRNPQYAEMVVRTNCLESYREGAQAELADPEMQAEFPAWRYVGIRDGRQGEDHEPMFDRYYPSTVTFNEVRGPRVWNCRCNCEPVHRTEWAELQRRGVRLESRW